MYEPTLYNNSKVIFIAGPYNVFNNIVSDNFKTMCTPESTFKMDEELYKEFGIDVGGPIKVSNVVDFETFMLVVNTPSIEGKWFCNTDYGTLTKKQKERLMNYIRKPNDNGVLSLFSTEWHDYKFLLNNKIISSSAFINIIQLSWPNRDTLYEVLRGLFRARNAKIEERGLELIILRMSDSYDEYVDIVDKICNENLPDGYLTMKPEDLPVITYDQVFESLRGIENYVLDDFIERITRPLTSDKMVNSANGGNALSFRMMKILIEEYTARGLVSKLKYKIDDFIEFRVAINSGKIPILVNFSVAESKELIGEESKLYKLSDYQFRKMARIASQTSLIDWLYIKLMLNNIYYRFEDTSYEIALFSMLSRSVLNESRVNNDIGIEDCLGIDMDYLDNINYETIEEATERIEKEKEQERQLEASLGEEVHG